MILRAFFSVSTNEAAAHLKAFAPFFQWVTPAGLLPGTGVSRVDHVRRGQAPPKPGGQAEAIDGEHLAHAFPETGRGRNYTVVGDIVRLQRGRGPVYLAQTVELGERHNLIMNGASSLFEVGN